MLAASVRREGTEFSTVAFPPALQCERPESPRRQPLLAAARVLTTPSRMQPVLTRPVQRKPVQRKPVQTKPVGMKPVQMRPVRTKVERTQLARVMP